MFFRRSLFEKLASSTNYPNFPRCVCFYFFFRMLSFFKTTLFLNTPRFVCGEKIVCSVRELHLSFDCGPTVSTYSMNSMNIFIVLRFVRYGDAFELFAISINTKFKCALDGQFEIWTFVERWRSNCVYRSLINTEAYENLDPVFRRFSEFFMKIIFFKVLGSFVLNKNVYFYSFHRQILQKRRSFSYE